MSLMLMRPMSALDSYIAKCVSRSVRTIIHGGRPAHLDLEGYSNWKTRTIRWNMWIKAVPGTVLEEWAHEFVKLHGTCPSPTPQADEVHRVKLTAYFRERADEHPDYGFGARRRRPGYIKNGVGARTVAWALRCQAFARQMAELEQMRAERRIRHQARLKRWARIRKLKAAWRRKNTLVPLEPVPTVQGRTYTYEANRFASPPLMIQKADTRERARRKALAKRKVA